MVETREEAIAWFESQGHHAFAMDTFAPGALFVSTSVKVGEAGIHWLQGSLVAIYPKGETWVVTPVPEMNMGPLFEEFSSRSLDDAVDAAETLIAKADERSGREQTEGKRGEKGT